MSAEPSPLVHGQEAFGHVAAIADRFTGMLVHQGLVDLLSTRNLVASDAPLHIDVLAYARCLEAIYTDRPRVAALASGAPSPLRPDEVSDRVAAAEAAGAIRRGAEALARCEALPEGPVRELTRFGLGVSAALLAAEAPRTPPVDFSVHARLLEGSFASTSFVKRVAEGREPAPFI